MKSFATFVRPLFKSHNSDLTRAPALLAGALATVFLLLISSPALAQGPLPSIQITGFENGAPANSCTDPGAQLDVFANGTAANSDNYTISVNGAVNYVWTDAENMSWAPQPSPPGGVHGYGAVGGTGTYAADSTITVAITTYAGATTTGSSAIAGQTPVYRSTISWNCTTGAQVGTITNVALNPNPTSVSAPAMSPWALLGGMLVLVTVGGLALRRNR